MDKTKTVFVANDDTQVWDRLDDGSHVGSYRTVEVVLWIKGHMDLTGRITVETEHNAPLT